MIVEIYAACGIPDRKVVFSTADDRICVGNRDNYDNIGHYNNDDGSLIEVSRNPAIFNLLSATEYTLTQQEMIDQYLFVEDDYREYNEIKEERFFNFLANIPRVKFADGELSKEW